MRYYVGVAYIGVVLYMPDKHSDSRIIVRTGLILIPVLFIVINITSLAFIDPLAGVMIEDRVLDAIDSITDVPIVRFLNQILPVIVLIILLGRYCLPLFRTFWNGRPGKTPDAFTIDRLLHAATTVAVYTAAGWVYSIPIVLFAGLILKVPMDLSFYLQYSSHSLILFGFDFIISYYIIEALVKIVILPRVLKGNEAVKSHHSFSLSIGTRLMILSFSSFILPSLIFFNTILILNNNGNNALHRDLMPILSKAIPVLILLVLIITTLKILSIEYPVAELTAAAKRVEHGNYLHGVTVSSLDRIGMLAAAFNKMMSGLGEREKMSRVFGKAVDPRIRDFLMEAEVSPRGEIKEASVVFFDLAGFSALSESVTPQKLVQLLNIYFEAVSSSVEMHGGLINKFIGDGVLAVFGVPNELEEHQEKALCAIENLQRLMARVNVQLAKKNVPPLHFRAGVHSGEVLSGLIGSKNRKEYTVIGDAVNVASRLEQLGKEHSVSVVLSRATADGLSNRRSLKPLGTLGLRGKKEPVELFTLNNSHSIQT